MIKYDYQSQFFRADRGESGQADTFTQTILQHAIFMHFFILQGRHAHLPFKCGIKSRR